MKMLTDIFKSGTAVMLGGALGIGIVISLLFRLYGNLDRTYLFLMIGGILLIVLLVGGAYLVWKWVEKRRKAQMEGALSEDAENKKLRRKEEKIAVNDINQRWGGAMAELKSSNVDLYQLPWVLLIGEPRSGKTTTLRESGLDFFMGKNKVSGAGGTVNCDWWFTREAVIIDTAGRFTMPVDSAPDAKEWQAFLKLLSKHRPRCPINGVIVTIPADSLLNDPADKIQEKAYKIKEKLQELSSMLKVEFPVYIMISKLDLVHGFSQFCDSLSARERTQVVGWNRKKLVSNPFDPQEFSQDFDSVVRGFRYWSYRRLKEMQPGLEADGVYAFPTQFQHLKESLGRYLGLVFAENPYHENFLWRGCFFSSGLQEGEAIAQALSGNASHDNGAMSNFAKSFVKSRAYFITEFYNKVFKERGHVKRSGKARKREQLTRWIAVGMTGVFILGMGGVLWPGYQSLSNIVTPLDKTLMQAQKALVTYDREYSKGKLDDAVAMASTLSNGYQALSSSGVKRFLKGRENQLVKDLGRVQDALLEKELILMGMDLVGEKLVESNPVETEAEKNALLAALKPMVGILAGQAQDASSMLDLLTYGSGGNHWLDNQQRENIRTILSGYPYGDRQGQYLNILAGENTRVREEMQFYVLRGLSRLRDYWENSNAKKWQDLQLDVADINAAWRSILQVKPDGPNPQGTYVERIRQFKAHTLALTSDEIEHFVWSDVIPETCSADYESLLDKGFAATATTLTRHAGVCDGLGRILTQDWPAWLAKNSHLFTESGQASEQLHRVLEVVNLLLDMDPLFGEPQRKSLEKEWENPTVLMDKWSAQWQLKIAALEKDIQEQLVSVTAPGWEKDRFLENLTVYFQTLIWQAERASAKTAMAVVLNTEDNFWAQSSGAGEVPVQARASWVLKRFATLEGIYNWLKARHPLQPELSGIQNTMGRQMAQAQYQLMKYWAQVIQAFDPGWQVRKARSWKRFREEVLASQGVFLDVGAWPLSALLAHVPPAGVEQIRSMVKKYARGPASPSALKRYEQRVMQTVYLHRNMNFVNALEQSQIDFLEGIRNQGQISDQDQPLDVSVNALKTYKMRVWRDRRAKGELLTHRLAAIGEHGKRLLRGHQDRAFTKDWNQFISQWHSRMGNRFPFGLPEEWTLEDGQLRSMTLKELHGFYFSETHGFSSLADKYHFKQLSKDQIRRLNLNSFQKTFIQNCMAWRNFLFDTEGRPRTHRLDVILDSEDSRDMRAATLFTTLQFSGLKNDKGNPIRLRFSGERHKRKEILWDPQSVSQIRVEARHVEQASRSELSLPRGSFALPAFILSHGSRGLGTVLDNEWSMEIRLPDTTQEGISTPEDLAYIPVPVRFIWDEDIPDNIEWPSSL